MRAPYSGRPRYEKRRDRWAVVLPLFREIRAARGLDSLAHEIETHRSSVDRWARGISVPAPRIIGRVAEVIARHTPKVIAPDRPNLRQEGGEGGPEPS